MGEVLKRGHLSLCPPVTGESGVAEARVIPLVVYSPSGVAQSKAECTRCYGSGGCVYCNTVVDLHAWDVDHSPHEAGYAQCTWCAQVWTAVVPIPGPAALTCPFCSRLAAIFPVALPTVTVSQGPRV